MYVTVLWSLSTIYRPVSSSSSSSLLSSVSLRSLLSCILTLYFHPNYACVCVCAIISSRFCPFFRTFSSSSDFFCCFLLFSYLLCTSPPFSATIFLTLSLPFQRDLNRDLEKCSFRIPSMPKNGISSSFLLCCLLILHLILVFCRAISVSQNGGRYFFNLPLSSLTSTLYGLHLALNAIKVTSERA